MINFLGKFIPDLSVKTMPLRALLDQRNQWDWSHEQDKAWLNLKEIVSKQPALKFYDPKKPIKIATDASKVGLGAVLQQYHDNEWLPVAYASRAVSDCELRYAPIELETLAVTFACERFHQYIYGQRIEVEADHKPLVTIFKKPLSESPLRIQRLRLRLQRYDLVVSYTPGKWMHAADAFSRSPVERADTDLEKNVQAYVDGVLSYVQVSDDKQKEIIEATMKDDQLKVLKETVSKGWPSRQSSCRPELKPYWNFREELSVHKGMILKGSRIVIPRAMRKEILRKIHVGHLGREKCKHRARQVVFWPQMNQDIDNIVSSCEVCRKYQHKQLKEPLKPYPVATRPWQVVGTDLFEVDKKDYVVLVDAYSNYPELDRRARSQVPQ